MSDHKPFTLCVDLLNGVRMTRYGVSLDGLLHHALFAHTRNLDKAQRKLGEYLTSRDGVYCASTMSFGVPGDGSQRLITYTAATVGVMKEGVDLDPELFAPNGKKGKYKKVMTEGGPYKNRLEKHDVFFAPYLLWEGVGNASEIARLLNFYITNIGLEAPRGFGTVRGFRVETHANDQSFVDEFGRPARVLPESVYEKRVGRDRACDINPRKCRAKVTPPYHDTEQEVPCVAPEQVRRVLVS